MAVSVVWSALAAAVLWLSPAAPADDDVVTLSRVHVPVCEVVQALADRGEAEGVRFDGPGPQPDVTALVNDASRADVARAVEVATLTAIGNGSVCSNPEDLGLGEELAKTRELMLSRIVVGCAELAHLSAETPELLGDDALRQAVALADVAAARAKGLKPADLQIVRRHWNLMPLILAPGGLSVARLVASMTDKTILSLLGGPVRVRPWALSEAQRGWAEEALRAACNEPSPLTAVGLRYVPAYAVPNWPDARPAGVILCDVTGTTGSAGFWADVTSGLGHPGVLQTPPEGWYLQPPPSWPTAPRAETALLRVLPPGDPGVAGDSWAETLQMLHRDIGLDVVSDAFPAVAGEFTPLPRPNEPLGTVEELLDYVGSRFGYRWSKVGEVYVLQNAFWFELRRDTLSQDQLRGMLPNETAAASPDWPYLLSLSGLTRRGREQVNAAAWRVFDTAAPAVPVLPLLATLTPEQRELFENAVLPAGDLQAPQQQRLRLCLEATSPDAPPAMEKISFFGRKYPTSLIVFAVWEGHSPVALEWYWPRKD
jgi:hypothetical protein